MEDRSRITWLSAIEWDKIGIHAWRLASAKIGQPAQPRIIATGLDRTPSMLGTALFAESFFYGI
jgi:hypothetical protein